MGEKTETGSVAFLFKDPSSPLTEEVGWKGKISVRAYVPRNDRLHYLRLIGADISSFETNKFQERKLREKEREAAKTAEVSKTEGVANNDVVLNCDIQPE